MGLPLDSCLISKAIKSRNGANKTDKINENMISSNLLKNNDSPPAVIDSYYPENIYQLNYTLLSQGFQTIDKKTNLSMF